VSERRAVRRCGWQACRLDGGAYRELTSERGTRVSRALKIGKMLDPHDLQRFVDAQERVYDQVCVELRRGRKTSHWMWFIFPQTEGLGHSALAKRYAISSLEEARAYLEHPILGPRLSECTRWVNRVEGKTIREILGYPDDLKFRSSMTLFAHATADNHEFRESLQKYYAGEPDTMTLERL
jgi:uncharacterized protein (DUF1810 family)